VNRAEPSNVRPRGVVPATLAFGALLLAALAGFWKPYLSVLHQQRTPLIHLHFLCMLAWCLLLVLQPLLIARGRWLAHRTLGRLAWGLAPLIVVSSLALAWVMARPVEPGAPIEEFRYGLFFLHLATSALFAAAVAAALALRHDRALHARLMVTSGLLFIDSVLSRVFVHVTGGPPWLQEFGSVLLSLLAFAFAAWWDRRAARGRWVFAVFGALNVLMQALFLVLPGWLAWRALVQALVA
jgi:hypothetical protein